MNTLLARMVEAESTQSCKEGSFTIIFDGKVVHEETSPARDGIEYTNMNRYFDSNVVAEALAFGTWKGLLESGDVCDVDLITIKMVYDGSAGKCTMNWLSTCRYEVTLKAAMEMLKEDITLADLPFEVAQRTNNHSEACMLAAMLSIAVSRVNIAPSE